LFFLNQFRPLGSYVYIIITSMHSAAKSKYSITTPPTNTYYPCRTSTNVFISAERRINQEGNNNGQEHVWLRRHRFVTDGTRSKQINCYQQVTAVEHVINRGCSIVSIVPPPTMHLTHTTAQQVPA